mmetsp:Transcript_8169/g.15627  ORF Transcript_8169/g.15627 Transcript_8169/m.15627 type:complete len:506 (-) Transcript_8169:343-1860(-)
MPNFSDLAHTLASDNAWPSINALTIISKNLVERPGDELIRILRCKNEAVQRKLLEYPAATQFLWELGFNEVEVDGNTFLSLGNNDPPRYRDALSALREISHRKSNSVNLLSGLGQQLRRPPLNFQRVSAPLASFQEVIKLEAAKRKLQTKPPLGETFLFYGPSGSGKALLAHAAADAWGLKVLTIWGTDVHSPFARSHTAALAHFATHAAELGSCMVLLRGMDPILASAVEEFVKQRALPRVVIVATCVATQSFAERRVEPLAHRRRPIGGNSNDRTTTSITNINLGSDSGNDKMNCSRGIIHRKGLNQSTVMHKKNASNDNRSESFAGRNTLPSSIPTSELSTLSVCGLECFDHLVHVPFEIQDTPSIALHLQRTVDNLGAALTHSAATEAAVLMMDAASLSISSTLSGHMISDVGKAAVQHAIRRGYPTGAMVIPVSVDMVRFALDDWREGVLKAEKATSEPGMSDSNSSDRSSNSHSTNPIKANSRTDPTPSTRRQLDERIM